MSVIQCPKIFLRTPIEFVPVIFFTHKCIRVRETKRDKEREREREDEREGEREREKKINDLLLNMREKSKKLFNLNENLSIDEAIINFHDKHSGVVGAPHKLAKEVIKLHRCR